ncbi:MAG: ABC transporter permease [Candidatus Humimicrobiaceae bacterium]
MKKNILNYLIAFLIIISLNFLIPRLLPGDPVEAIYGSEAMLNLSPEAKDEIMNSFGLGEPLYKQYFNYILSVFKGDFGYSLYHNSPVFRVILSYLPWTLSLMGSALVFSTIIGVVLGMESGWRRGGWTDKFLLNAMIFSSSFPSFFIGILFLIIFGVLAGILPMQGAQSIYLGLGGIWKFLDIVKHMVLPMASLVLVFTPSVYLLTRNSMISNLTEPYILLAKAKGLREPRIKYYHAGKNSIIPVVTQTGIRLATRLVTGALFIEIIFSYPGMGNLIYNSIQMRDYPMLQGSLLVVAVLVLLINIALDFVYKKIDPRISNAY